MSLQRIYLSQAIPALESWLSGPKLTPGFTGFALTLKAEDQAGVDAALAFRDRVLAHGLECLIGFRGAETFTHPANWCDPRFWAESAATIRRLVLAGVTDAHIDLEAYKLHDQPGKVPTKDALALIGRTPAQLRLAMEPFLAALEPLERLRIYPAHEADEAIIAVYDRVISTADKIEMWCERFDLAKQIMRDPHGAHHYALAMAYGRARVERRFPEAALVRDGDYDWLWRAVGNEARRSWMDAYGAYEPWGFLTHQHTDEGALGSLDWYDSVKLGAANRVAHAWALSSATLALEQVGMSSVRLLAKRARTTPELSSTILSTCGFRLCDGRYLQAPKVLPERVEVVWACAFDGEVPYAANPANVEAGYLPVMGESQANRDSWAVCASDGKLWLRLAGNPREYLPIAAFERGRFAVARAADGTFRVAVGDEVYPLRSARPPRVGAGSLYFGSMSTPGGTNTTPPMAAEGLVMGRAEVHLRDVPNDELLAIAGQPYPRE